MDILLGYWKLVSISYYFGSPDRSFDAEAWLLIHDILRQMASSDEIRMIDVDAAHSYCIQRWMQNLPEEDILVASEAVLV
jgi:hypothetical protein